MQAGQSSPHMCVEYNQFFEERSGHIDMHIYILYHYINLPKFDYLPSFSDKNEFLNLQLQNYNLRNRFEILKS